MKKLNLLMAICCLMLLWQNVNAQIWRLGRIDDSNAEFQNYKTASPEIITASGIMETPNLSKGMNRQANPAIEINFNLTTIPANGVNFKFKLLDAHALGQQLAVFLNESPLTGLIQLWGTGGTSSSNKWKKTYQLYIPKEFLVVGANKMRLESALYPYSNTVKDFDMWFEWDYLMLEALASPATEPIHGKMSYLGNSMKKGADDFTVDMPLVNATPVMLKWMGIAYSQNPMRADFWRDVAQVQPNRLELLEVFKEYNMTVVADNVPGAHIPESDLINTEGTPSQIELNANWKKQIDDFFNKYRSYFQYYEIDNEPTLIGGPGGASLKSTMAVANYVNQIKPSWVKTTAPGYAYGTNKGIPLGWERDDNARKSLETLVQATNGHSYGSSYSDLAGGSFNETLDTYAPISDGWPKEYVNTETGTNDWHTDEPNTTSQPHASIFDRILRAHMAVVDRAMQHATIFGDFGLFVMPNWNDPSSLQEYPGVNGEDPRIQTYRRVALSYATHGAPLKYTYLNSASVKGQPVYFRAVNTATLAAIPGSGATSDKVLLNFVNFSNVNQTVSVRVTMPAPGTYSGERIADANNYNSARTTVASLSASPDLDLTVTLPPRQSIQYILSGGSLPAPKAPASGSVVPGNQRLKVLWSASTFATSYDVKRSTSLDGPYTTIASDIASTSYFDASVNNQETYYYKVAAKNGSGTSPDSAPFEGKPSTHIVLEFENASIGGGVNIQNDAAASGEKVVGGYHNWGAYVNFTDLEGGNGGTYNLTIHYANGTTANATKSLYINGVDVKQLIFPSTGGWSTYGTITTAITLNAGMNNTIKIQTDGLDGDKEGINADKIEYTLGTVTDNQSPTVPTALTSPSKTATSVNLSWTASTDDTGVTGYEVYRDGVSVGLPTGTTFSATGLVCNTAYSFTVRARDAAGNWSGLSAALAVTTNACAGDTTPPTVPASLTSPTKTTTSVKLSWTASTDNTAVTGYDVFVNGTSVGTSTGTSFSATGLTCNTAYSFSVRAKDAAGNVSAQSSTLRVTTSACTSTLRDPENPANTTAGLEYKYYEGTWIALPVFSSLTAVKSGNTTGFDLSVRNRDDNFAFSYTGFVNIPTDGTYTFYTSSDDGSKLYIGNTQVVDNDGSHSLQERSGSIGLKAGKHAITVTFFEQGGDQSLIVSYSSSAITKTAIPASALFRAATADTQAPTVPTSLTSTAKTATSVNLSWTASTDDTGVTGYEVFVNGASVGTSTGTTYNATGLACNTAYSFAVRAKDAAGNASALSTALSVTTNACLAADIDLVVTDISWTPASPATGNVVTFSAVVKNQGSTATPAGTIIGVAFSVNGSVVSWSDNSTASLAGGSSRTVTSNGGPNSSATWTAGVNGTYNILAHVDDVNRMTESVENNNTRTETLTVATAVTGFSGNYTLIARHSGKALKVAAASTADGANVQQWTYEGRANQIWTITSTGSGYYKLTATHCGKVLDVDGAGTANGVNVQQWNDNGSSAQRWLIESVGDGYYKLIAECSGKALEVAGNSTADGANVHQWEYLGGANQQWQITQVGTSSSMKASNQEEIKDNSIKLYPMPVAQNELNISFFSEANQKLKIDFTTTDGRQVKNLSRSVNRGLNTFAVPVGELKNGIYLLKIQSAVGKRLIRKVIIAR